MTFIPEKILVFDIFGDYAQFRKFFTNMSPLTFSIPPRTVLAGIMGAIAGIKKEENPESFLKANSFISLKINNPVKKVKIPLNYIKTESRTKIYRYEAHKPTNVEFLKDPSFRIYFSHKDFELYSKIKENLKFHKSVYTVNLGISCCICDFKFIGEFNLEEKQGKASMSSVVPKSKIKTIEFGDSLIQQCTLPNIYLNSREVQEYKEFLYEIKGGLIKGEMEHYYKIDEMEENIIEM